MPLYNTPVSLEKLSLEAFGNYVSELSTGLLNLAVSSKDKPPCSVFSLFKMVLCQYRALQWEDSSIGLHHAEDVSRRLRHTLQAAVVRKLANKITHELLNTLDNSDTFRYINSPFCERILQELVYASLHSDLTELDITYRHIASFVVSRMWAMGKLRTLKVTSRRENEAWLEDVKKYLPTFSYLEEFSFRMNCTDDVLDVLCRSCRHLKRLDVSGSYCVTDESVTSIVRLTCLEKLDLICTGISEKGHIDLVNGFALRAVYVQQPHCMKNFGCDCYSYTQLRILVTNLINIREISLRMCDFHTTLSALEHLEDLQVLRLKYFLFTDVTDLLLTRGYQLLELEVENSGNLDLKFVCESCPCLVKLVIRDRTYKYENCGSFPKLQHLILQTGNSSAVAHLLCRCRNLTSLELCTVQEFYESHMASVLKKNPFEHLRSLSMGTLSGCLSPGAVGIVSEHCVKLSEFNVFGEPGVNMEALCQLYPGVQVVPELWSQLVNKEAIVNAGLNLHLFCDGTNLI
jgi:hypothetical protein